MDRPENARPISAGEGGERSPADKPVETRQLLISVIAGLLAMPAIALSGLAIYGWQPAEPFGFRLSDPLSGLFGPPSMAIGAAVLLLQLRSPPRYCGLSMLLTPWLFLVAIALEMKDEHPGHSLLGIELIVLGVVSALLHTPLFGIKLLVWARSRLAIRKATDGG